MGEKHIILLVLLLLAISVRAIAWWEDLDPNYWEDISWKAKME